MKIGDKVKVMYGITDPKGKQGKFGLITKIEILDEDNAFVWVRFEDGVKGIYDKGCLWEM